MPVICRQRKAPVVPHRQRKNEITKRQQPLHPSFREYPHHHRRQHHNYKRPRPKHQSSVRRRVPVQALQHLWNQHRRSVQTKPKQKIKDVRQRKISVRQQPDLHHRVRMPPLPHNRKYQRHHRNREKRHDKIALEPVFRLPAIQHHLQARKRHGHGQNPQPIHLQLPIFPRRFYFLLEFRRVRQHPVRQDQRNNSNRNINEEHPPPASPPETYPPISPAPPEQARRRPRPAARGKKSARLGSAQIHTAANSP